MLLLRGAGEGGWGWVEYEHGKPRERISELTRIAFLCPLSIPTATVSNGQRNGFVWADCRGARIRISSCCCCSCSCSCSCIHIGICIRICIGCCLRRRGRWRERRGERGTPGSEASDEEECACHRFLFLLCCSPLHSTHSPTPIDTAVVATLILQFSTPLRLHHFRT